MATLLTQDKDFFPRKLADKFLYLKNAGFDGFEIDGKILLDQFDEVQLAMAATKFPVVSACGGYGGWIGDFDEHKRKAGLRDLTVMLERLAIIGGTGIVVPAAWGMFSYRLPPMVSPRSAEDDEKALLHSLDHLNGIAAKHNTRIFLEPLNRYEDHMINTLEKGAYYITKGGFSHVRLTADFYHMNIEESDIAMALQQHSAVIGHVHLADNHRYQPGTGHIDFKGGLDALRKTGYSGAFAIECRVAGNQPEEAYLESLHYVRSVLSLP